MCQTKATRIVTVANPDGLHIRAASLVAKLTGQRPAKVELIKGNRRVDATNVLQILSLCALEGDQLLLEATGREAGAALEALVELFENQFDEAKSSRKNECPADEPRRADAASEGDPSRG